MKILLIIPSYNEEENVLENYNRIIDYDFINFTPDSTYEPLRRMKPSSSSSSVTQGITGSSYAYYYYPNHTRYVGY